MKRTYISGVISVHHELSLPFFALLPPQVIKIKVKQVRAPELIVFPLGGVVSGPSLEKRSHRGG
jgi:hypothetical protein